MVQEVSLWSPKICCPLGGLLSHQPCLCQRLNGAESRPEKNHNKEGELSRLHVLKRSPARKVASAEGRHCVRAGLRRLGPLEGRGGDEKEMTTDNLPYFPLKVSSFQDN